MASTIDFQAPSNETHKLTLLDGRTLAYTTYGIERTSSPHLPIFYFHGFPASRLEGGLWHSTTLAQHIHLIAPDRPGMGQSTLQENRTILDWADDILALADHLEISDFNVLGVSGGGPYALACLSRIPKERLHAVAVVSGLYPMSLGSAGMLFKSRLLLWAAPWTTGLVGSLLDFGLGKPARDVNPETFTKLLETDLLGNDRPEVDRLCFKDALGDTSFRTPLIESVRESMKISTKGAAWEARLYGSDWGFKLSHVDAARLVVWHGGMDVNVPVTMADKAAKEMKGVMFKRFDEEGHFSLPIKHAEEILKSIVQNT